MLRCVAGSDSYYREKPLTPSKHYPATASKKQQLKTKKQL